MTLLELGFGAFLAFSTGVSAMADPIRGATTPGYLAKTDPAVKFPDSASSWAKGGRFVAPANVRLIAPGMSRQQVYALVGEPMFNELLPFQKSWNYILNFYTGQGSNAVQCPYQIRWAGGHVVSDAYWRDAACAKYVADEPALEPVKPPPPPAAAMPPAAPERVAKSYVVYFPFDRSTVTPEALDIVHSVATYANGGHGARVAIVGFTDSSGSRLYDEALSERRAKAVADALTASRIEPGSLDVSWRGKSDLAVATPDGVKEPLNRRATIKVSPVN